MFGIKVWDRALYKYFFLNDTHLQKMEVHVAWHFPGVETTAAASAADDDIDDKDDDNDDDDGSVGCLPSFNIFTLSKWIP